MGTGVFSDFAKSLREMQGVELDFSGETVGTVGEGIKETVEGSGGSSGREGDVGDDGGYRRGGTRGGGRKGATEGSSKDGELLGMSDSFVIDDADMEVGGYARAREELRGRKDAAAAAARGESGGGGLNGCVVVAASAVVRPDAAGSSPDSAAAINPGEVVEGQHQEGGAEEEKQRAGDGARQRSEGDHGDGFLEGSDELHAVAAVGATGEGTSRRNDNATRGRKGSKSPPARSWDEGYEDDGFEPDDGEDEENEDRYQRIPEKSPIVERVVPGEEPARSRRAGPQSSGVMSQPMSRFGTSAAADAAAAEDRTAPVSPTRLSETSLPPSPPASPPPQNVGTKEQEQQEHRSTVRATGDSRFGIVDGDRKHGEREGDSSGHENRGGGGGSGNCRAGDSSSGVNVTTAVPAQMSPAPSPPPSPPRSLSPPPPPLHLPEDELALDRGDGGDGEDDDDNAAGYYSGYRSGGRLVEVARGGEPVVIADSRRNTASNSGAGGGGDGELYSNNNRSKASGRYYETTQQAENEMGAIAATLDTTPSFLRQRSRVHDGPAGAVITAVEADGGREYPIGRVIMPLPESAIQTEQRDTTSAHVGTARKATTGIRIPSAGPTAAASAATASTTAVDRNAISGIHSSRCSHHRLAVGGQHDQQHHHDKDDRRPTPAQKPLSGDRERVTIALEGPTLAIPEAGACDGGGGDGGPWDVPTTAPSLAELEYQLRKLSPLRTLSAHRKPDTKRTPSHTRARRKTGGHSSLSSSDHAKAVGRSPGRVATATAAGDGSREIGFSVQGQRKGSTPMGGGGRGSGRQQGHQSLVREDFSFRGRGAGVTGVGSGGFQGEDGKSPAGRSGSCW